MSPVPSDINGPFPDDNQRIRDGANVSVDQRPAFDHESPVAAPDLLTGAHTPEQCQERSEGLV
jgi:hypothetical protein